MGSSSNKGCLAGMEVPFLDTDSLKWLQVSIPSSTNAATAENADTQDFDGFAKDIASCSVLGRPPTYLIWKICKNQPNVLEIVEMSGRKTFPKFGLRILFPGALFPFAFIHCDQGNAVSGTPYMLYAITITGSAFFIRLRHIENYASCSIFPLNEVVEYNTQNYPHCGTISAVAATVGCLAVGRSDGSLSCFKLGAVDPNAPGFAHELKDEAGFGRLWGIMSRGRSAAMVRDLVILEIYQKKLLFVLQSDGVFRVWDLLTYSRIFSYNMSTPTSPGAAFLRLWVGEASSNGNIIPLAVLYKDSSEAGMEIITLQNLFLTMGDRMSLSIEPPLHSISLEEGGCIDLKLTSNKVWVLKDDGLLVQECFDQNISKGLAHCYSLQEAYVADQLFQSAEHSSDDLLWLAHTVFSSKDQVAPFVSSIFLRRLLLPGVYHNSVIRTTLQDYNKHFSDSEFESLTVEGLKSEILSVIEQEGGSGGPVTIFRCWKNFCSRYFQNWCRNSVACGLLIDSSSHAVGLIRKNTVTLCRGLEDIEHLILGSDETSNVISSGTGFSGDDLEQEVLFDVLQCISNVSQQLGRASSAIFYESLVRSPSMLSEELVSSFLKVLETGYSSSIAATYVSEMGADVAFQKEVSSHKNLRKFSADIFMSLHSLCNRAIRWAKVFDVIQSYLKFLVPHKIIHNSDFDASFHVNTSIAVQATCQVAKVMFESALDVLVLLGYMVNISGQIHMSHSDVTRVKDELIPMIQEILTEWHIIHFLGTTPSESRAVEDFSLQLSSLQIDGNVGKRSWTEMLGKCEFTLAFILLLDVRCSSEDQSHLSYAHLPDPGNLIGYVREFSSWIIWGSMREESSMFFSHSFEIALVLLKYSQYDAVEYLLTLVDAYAHNEKTAESLQTIGGEWSTLLHLLGCCLVVQTQRGLQGMVKARKIYESVRCFFRAAAMQGAPQALQSLPYDAGCPPLSFDGATSAAGWRLHYYQWAMQIFEQYNMSEAASQFAVAALEQVDEAIAPIGGSSHEYTLEESATTVKGRLWANVFKFALDVNHYYDAYCAIISNPDEESKNICLRRFMIVLYERGAVKSLCDGQLPFIGLTEKVEHELAWKAERSDVLAMPNPYKLLYAFEMKRHNWRRAAYYMYLYSARLRTEATLRDEKRSFLLQERLDSLSAAINALQLLHPAYAWINLSVEETSHTEEQYPNKKARITMQQESAIHDARSKGPPSVIDTEKLENEFVLTSSEYLLSLANIKWISSGDTKPSSELVDMLVESNLYDMAFTVVLRFWKGSGLKRKLERIFSAMSLKCSPSKTSSSFGNDKRMHGLLLTSSQNELIAHGSLDMSAATVQSKGNTEWGTLQLYLDKYIGYHPRLPVIVAETLLSSDHQIDLPLWLVQKFKNVQKESSFGMTGSESDSASLFRLYVDYGRYAEATTLLVEYVGSLASLRPADVVRRKRTCAVWFPYTSIERLWCQLEESIKLGHMIDQCEQLKKLLHGALRNHLNLVKVDSDDLQSSMVQ